jgi:hypothetical protein
MSRLPEGLRPMLAVTTTALPADTGAWAAEVKWDGYRALCLRDQDRVRLHSRRGTDMVGWFPELGGLHHALGGHEVVLDGEVVAGGGSSAAWITGCFRRPAGGWRRCWPAPPPPPARSSARSPPEPLGQGREQAWLRPKLALTTRSLWILVSSDRVLSLGHRRRRLRALGDAQRGQRWHTPTRT